MSTTSRKQILIRTFRSNKTSVVGLLMVFCLVMIAIISPWISPYDPISQDMNVQHAPPGWAHPFGTDSYGRDQLSRILWGARVSLVVGILSVLFAMAAGIPLGMIGGYKGGI
ncbi:MAG: ABC transporter permease, partial [Thermodesulfobacteriota bacterium]